MNAKPMFLTLGLYLLAMTLAASAPKASWFEAHTTGPRRWPCRARPKFGPGAGTPAEAPFVLTLGAESPTGAVVFTRPNRRRPAPECIRSMPMGRPRSTR